MMRKVKWGVYALLALMVFGFFHYTLPQHDIVRVVGTYEERQDLQDWTRIFWAQPDDKTAALQNRDVLFIQAVDVDGRSRVYRNEDTGGGWPPYFKFDTANLQTEAADAVSDKDAPEWFSVTHYGWRNEFLSIFPNAIAVKPVSGPDATIIPWVNIVILTALVIFLFWVWRVWRRFKERRIEPIIDEASVAWDGVEDRAEAVSDSARGIWGRFTGWLGTWRGKPRK